VRADLVRALDDRARRPGSARLEDDVGDRDEQRPLVDRATISSSSRQTTISRRRACA
jgi:hypothetical protein